MTGSEMSRRWRDGAGDCGREAERERDEECAR